MPKIDTSEPVYRTPKSMDISGHHMVIATDISPLLGRQYRTIKRKSPEEILAAKKLLARNASYT